MSETKNLPAPSRRRIMQIKNLCPGLMEIGKIKIGRKGQMKKSSGGNNFQMPQKLDHFLITTMERGGDNNFLLDENVHGMLGESPKEIPVRLLYDDPELNFPTRYVCYNGKTMCCSGDGETASRLTQGGDYKEVQCPCERQEPTYAGANKCKINGVLSVMIDGAGCVGGVWKFRTTSYNSVVGILSSLALIRRITGGRLAGIPLTMTVTPKSVADPVKGSQQTIYVVGLQYRGTVESLQNTGYQIAMNEAKHGVNMEMIEQEARRMLTYDGPALGADDSADDIVEEFYPEEVTREDGAPPVLVDDVPEAETVKADPEPEKQKRQTRKKKAEPKKSEPETVEADVEEDEPEQKEAPPLVEPDEPPLPDEPEPDEEEEDDGNLF